MKTIAELNHELLRISHIDRTTFFGRLDILDYFCEKTHEKLGEKWRKFGRYGNVVYAEAMFEALRMMVTEADFSRAELVELHDWLKGNAKSYGNPDEAVGALYITIFLDKEYFALTKSNK
jgi:hypothetical protein